jgi:fructose-1,6-bisphosphatase II / sedoheptulose-1,7-bisphosphatase
VQFGREVIETETVVMRSTSDTIRWIRAEHRQLGKFRWSAPAMGITGDKPF